MRFTAVLRARSRAKVRREDPPLVLQRIPTETGPITLVVRTRYDQEEFDVAVPRELWVEAQGDAETIEDGVNASWRAAAVLIPTIALTANAAIGDLQPHLAFETTEGIEDRAFFQSTIETERGIPPPGRRVPIEDTVAVLQAVAATGRDNVRDATRLLRAANHYLLALNSWKRHNELLCVSHLFMAAEALKVVALRRELRRPGIDEDALAESWEIRPGEPRTRPLLEAAARRRVVFHGDDDTEKQAADISDGFEHGYKDFGDLHGPSRNVRDQTGRLIRASFLTLAGVPEVVHGRLTSGRHENPVDMTDYVRYMRGRLVGAGPELAREEDAYPHLEWTSAPKLTDAGQGRLAISGEETFTVRTSDSIASRRSGTSSGAPTWIHHQTLRTSGIGRKTTPMANGPCSPPGARQQVLCHFLGSGREKTDSE
jgi:hypothetical protein